MKKFWEKINVVNFFYDVLKENFMWLSGLSNGTMFLSASIVCVENISKLHSRVEERNAGTR